MSSLHVSANKHHIHIYTIQAFIYLFLFPHKILLNLESVYIHFQSQLLPWHSCVVCNFNPDNGYIYLMVGPGIPTGQPPGGADPDTTTFCVSKCKKVGSLSWHVLVAPLPPQIHQYPSLKGMRTVDHKVLTFPQKMIFVLRIMYLLCQLLCTFKSSATLFTFDREQMIPRICMLRVHVSSHGEPVCHFLFWNQIL